MLKRLLHTILIIVGIVFIPYFTFRWSPLYGIPQSEFIRDKNEFIITWAFGVVTIGSLAIAVAIFAILYLILKYIITGK